MHLGELEGIAEPVAGGLAAMVRREVLPDHVVPPLAGRAVKAIREADERPLIRHDDEFPGAGAPAGFCLIPVLTVLLRAWSARLARLARKNRHHGAEGRVGGMALHDGFAAGQFGRRRVHRQRVDPGKRVQFGSELLGAQFPQPRFGAHASSVCEVPARRHSPFCRTRRLRSNVGPNK